MKNILILVLLIWTTNGLFSQQTIQPISNDAQDGALYNAAFADDGSLSLEYGLMKKKETAFVDYFFSPDLKFIKENESAEPKAKKLDLPEVKYDYIYTSVGGCSSFDILSMSLNVDKYSVTKTWNNKKQHYVADIKKSSIGEKKGNKFNYKGYVGYYDAKSGANLVLVKENDKSKDDAKQYKLVKITLDGNVKEIPIGELAQYSIVFSELVKKNPGADNQYDDPNLAEYNALFVFAPYKESGANPKDYVVLLVDGDGNIIWKTPVTMPSVATIITDVEQNGNDIYFFGMTSPGKAKYYRDEFMDYSNIANPCYPDFYNYRDNQREINLTKVEPDNLVMMKISDGKLAYLNTTPASVLNSKKVVPPSVKKVPKTPFTKFHLQAFRVFANGDILVAGQRTKVVTINKTSARAYEDLICLHFDNSGNLKAEYYVEPQLATSKKDQVFQMQHMFIPSQDKKTAYWIMFEPEGVNGYANFWDAMNDRKTLYANFQPVVMKIDLDGVKISDPELPLGKEYLSYSDYSLIFRPNSSEAVFLGHTRKSDKVGLTKYDFK